MSDAPAPGLPTSRLRPGRHVMLVVGLGLVLGLAVQGARGLHRPDEGRYVAVAVGMLESGDWLRPYVHHETAHYTKPPMTYWSLAASMAVFGRNTFAARLPNAVAFALTLLALLAAARRLLPRRPWLPVALYAMCAFPRIAAHIVTTDTLLTLWTTLAGCSFIAWRFDPARPRRWLVGMYVAFALGFATKGPPALLPLLAILVFTVVHDGWRRLADLGSWRGAVAFLVLGLGWYAAVVAEQPSLARTFLQKEVADRFASGAHHRNSHPIHILRLYIPLLLFGTFPWMPYTLRGVVRAVRPPDGAAGAAGAAGRFLLAWVAAPTVVLMAASSRLPLYLLQVFPPLVLLGAMAAPEGLLRQRRSAAWLAALMLLGTAGLLAARWIPSDDDSRVLANEIREAIDFAPDEVVFLHQPHLGLAMYLDCEVEQIALDGAEGDDAGHPLQSVAAEVAEREPAVLYCVEPQLEAGFVRRVEAAGRAAERLGQTTHYVLYGVRAPG